MGLSLTHMLFLAVILLLFFGPNRLPAAGKSLGEAIRALKKSLDGEEIDVTDASKKPVKKEGDEDAKS